jgi:exodeoxyribonuclease-5
MPIDFKNTKKAMKLIANMAKKAKKEGKDTEARNHWKKYFEIKESWLDLRAVYASSVHKSQGSTYETVFIDLADIGANWDAISVARLMYVAVSRASKKVVCYGRLPNRYT